jgi:hypothetical protein
MQGRSVVQVDTVEDGAVAWTPPQTNVRDTRAQKKGVNDFWFAPNLLRRPVPTECPEELFGAQLVLRDDASVPRHPE